MKRASMCCVALALGSVLCAGTAGAQAGRDLKTIDVCRVVPGETVAAAVGGKLAEVRPFNPNDGSMARCTYLVDLPGPEKPVRKGYAIWLFPPGDFVELRGFTESKMTDVSGLGDGAYIFQDSGDGRFKIRFLRKGDVTIEATGDTADAARKVAGVAAASLAKAK